MAIKGEVRVVLVGAGVRGRVWAAVSAEAPGVALVGVVDQDPSTAESVSEESAFYEDVASALEECRPDAVIIATPPETHYAIGKAALSAGKHVLCEKPLSEDMGRGRRSRDHCRGTRRSAPRGDELPLPVHLAAYPALCGKR